MVLKRKRSESELSFSSAFSSPQQPGHDKPFDFAISSTIFSPAGRGLFSKPTMSSHPSGRTMKRFRDNRPSQAEVHQRTLNILYSAQQHQQEHAQGLGHTQSSSPESVAIVPPSFKPDSGSCRTTHQRSLHSFWNLPSARVPTTLENSPSPPISTSGLAASNSCEDCGAGLGGGDGDDIMMDIDSYGLEGGDHTCGACGKTVCFSCSVSNLGEDRRCLVCAGRRPGVENIGWKASGVGVC